MVQLIGLLADNPGQPVCLVDNMLSLFQHSTDHHLGHVIWIGILDVYIGWLLMCLGVPNTTLNWRTALLQNCPPILEFQNYLRYIWLGF